MRQGTGDSQERTGREPLGSMPIESHDPAQRFIGRMARLAHSARFGWLAAALLVVFAGCHKSPGDSGSQNSREDGGERFSASVNGLTVLADMLTAAGDTVRMRRKLSPVLQEEADVVIWAPDDFSAPDADACKQIDDWLRAKEQRTFVYIGHDFDARPVYWRHIVAQAPPPDRAKYQRELDNAETRFADERNLAAIGWSNQPESAECDWFTIDNSAAHRDVRLLGGDWSEGINALQVEIELNSRMIPADDEGILLSDGEGEMLVGRKSLECRSTVVPWVPGVHTSNRILIANGSFLFNVPLVNHEHRKLAGRLIESLGQGKHVVILDSQNHHPISDGRNDDNSPDQAPQSMLDIFNVWPLSAILVQWGIVIVALCFSKWAIFGPPRDPPPPPASDFGRHVEALGAAMAVTGDAAYAQSRVKQYRQVRDAIGPRAINRTNVKKQN